MSLSFFEDAPIIHSYTRADAIDDGELVDVSETAREAGIKFPVAITRAAWARYVEFDKRCECQDEAGCRAGQTCAYHATIQRITDSGVGLHQRLAVVDYSSIASNQHEAAIIRAELAARRAAR